MDKQKGWAEKMAGAYERGLKAGRSDKRLGIIDRDVPQWEEFPACWQQGYQHGWNLPQDEALGGGQG